MLSDKGRIKHEERMEKVDRVRKMAAKGFSVKKMAEEVGRHPSTVKNWVSMYSIKIMKPETEDQKREKLAIKTWAKRKSFDDVAEALDISEKSAMAKIREYIRHGKCSGASEARVTKHVVEPPSIKQMEKERLKKMPAWIADAIRAERKSHGVEI